MAKLKGLYRDGEVTYNRRRYRVLLKKGEVLNLPALRASGGEVEFDVVANPVASAGSKQKVAQDVARLDRKYIKKPVLS